MTASRASSSPGVAAAIAGILAVGCAHPPQDRLSLKVKPVETPNSSVSRTEGYYGSAVAAIERRDYAQALEMLQAARMNAPADIRVLNAFGVVYDKLGRFDLSARYYAQAAALDPQSDVVRTNMTYSLTLRGPVAASPAASVASVASVASAKAAPPAAPQQVVEEHQASIPAPQVLSSAMPRPGEIARFAAAAIPSTPASSGDLGSLSGRQARPAPAPASLHDARPVNAPIKVLAPPPSGGLRPLARPPLYIVNASGISGKGEPVRARLARLGWSTPRWALLRGAPQHRTTIYYPRDRATVAQALSNTLPVRVKLSPCSCAGLKLVLGADTARWRAPLKSTSNTRASRA